MSVLTEMQAAAVEIFDAFESMVINATYIQESSTYIPGGDITVASTEYSIRLIRDTRRAELALATDIPRDAKKYLLIVAELDVVAQAKDKIRIGTQTQSIIAVENDPGDVVAVIYVG